MADDDVKKSLSDRMGDRFDNPSRSEQDDEDEDTNETESSQPEKSSKNAKSAKNAKNAMLAKNVKEDWNATSVYLPEFLDRQLTTTYKHADLDYEEQFGKSLQKTRYYYPLVVSLGMECIEEMDAQELKECMERLEEEASEE